MKNQIRLALASGLFGMALVFFEVCFAHAQVPIVQPDSGGTGQDFSFSMAGGIPYIVTSGTFSMLSAGTNGDVLTMVSGLPAWASSPSSTYTVSAPLLLSGSNISVSAASSSTLGVVSISASGGLAVAAGLLSEVRPITAIGAGLSLSGGTLSVVSGAGTASLPSDYISGLIPSYALGGSYGSVVIGTGTCYVPAGSSLVTISTPLTWTPVTALTASSFYFIYLNTSGVLSESTSSPNTNYQGTAWEDSAGDRYLGSVLTNSSGQIYNFQRVGNEVRYRTNIFVSPFYVLSNASAPTTSTSVSCSSCIPPTSSLATCLVYFSCSGSGQSVTFGESNGLIPTSSTLDNQLSIFGGSGTAAIEADLDLNLDASQSFLYCATSSGCGVYIKTIGYKEDR